MEDTAKRFLAGPDQILPATGLTTTQPHGAVLFRDMEATKDVAPMSVPTLLKRTAAAHPDKTALAVKRGGEWLKWSYKQGGDSIEHFLA